MPKGQQARSD